MLNYHFIKSGNKSISGTKYASFVSSISSIDIGYWILRFLSVTPQATRGNDFGESNALI